MSCIKWIHCGSDTLTNLCVYFFVLNNHCLHIEKYYCSMSVHQIVTLISCLMLVHQEACAELSLVPTSSSVIENGTYTMQCITTLNVTYSNWIRNSNDADTAIFGYRDDTCLSTSFIKDQPQMFNYSCYRNDTVTIYSLTLLNVSRYQNGDTWQCRDSTFTHSNRIVVQVLVPVKSLYFNEHDSNILTLREDDSKRISCITSYSRPSANVTWYITGRQSKVYLSDSNTSYNTSTELVSTRSTLDVTLNRTYNEWDLVCEAENVQGYNAVSKSVLLNVTYPTNRPTIQCTNNGIYKVVQNTNGRLSCSVDGGNPAGTLHWNCTGVVTNYREPNNNVTQTIVWNVTQIQHCTCTATDIAGTHHTSVKIEVLYPPVIDALQDKAEFEGDSVILQCVVLRANPSVSVIGWTSNKHNITGATLLIPNVSRTDEGMYRCTANNTMDPSCQDIIHDSAFKSIHVNVLYPPSVMTFHEARFTVTEGDLVSLNCPVELGNPPSTNMSWRRSTDNKTWGSSNLIILNVKRYDESGYSCDAYNVMVNSDGIKRIGNVSADIRLIVQFKANVTDFYIRGYSHNTSIIIMENTSLVFECHIQSNPTSDVSIFGAERTLVNSSRANKLLYYTRATCAGRNVTYSCHGNNSLNNKPSIRQIHLVVKCKPRANTNTSLQFIVASAINQTVSMSYTVLAYPPPSFVRYRNGSSIDTSDPRTIVSSSNLQTNLTIIHVHKNDFGEYMLYIANDVGSIIELFQLKPEEHAVESFPDTTHNVSAIVGGLLGGLGILCGIAVFVFIYRRFVKHNQPESSTDQSLPPVTYENLKIEHIPKEPIEYQRDTSDNQPSDTSDNAYEGLSRQDGDKENQYTQLATPAMTAND